MNVEKAGFDDIDTLVNLRLDYLYEDNGSLSDSDVSAIRKGLPDYFREHMDKDLFVYVIRERRAIVACAFLLTQMKPLSPSFINGRTGIVLNVYTCQPYRRRGYAKKIMEALLEEAKRLELSAVELKSTEDGYPLYRSVGFMDVGSRYHMMRWERVQNNEHK